MLLIEKTLKKTFGHLKKGSVLLETFFFSVKLSKKKSILSHDTNSPSLCINEIEAKICTVLIIWLVGVDGIKQFPGSDWLQERARYNRCYLAALDFLIYSRREKRFFWLNNKSFIDQACPVHKEPSPAKKERKYE